MIGTVVVNETVFPIIDILLVDGMFIVRGFITGPVAPFDGGVTDVEVFGRDGSHVFSVRVAVPAWPRMHAYDTLEVPLPVRIVEAVPA